MSMGLGLGLGLGAAGGGQHEVVFLMDADGALLIDDTNSDDLVELK